MSKTWIGRGGVPVGTKWIGRIVALVVLIGAASPASVQATDGAHTRTAPYDAGIVCVRDTTASFRGGDGLRTVVSEWCGADEGLSKHGILRVGGAPVPATHVGVWVPECLPLLCTCVGPLCASDGDRWEEAETPGRGSPASASTLVRILAHRGGSLRVSAVVSGASGSPVCLEVITARSCSTEIVPEATIAVVAEVQQGDDIWVAVRTGPAQLGHPAVPAPGIVAVHSMSYSIN